MFHYTLSFEVSNILYYIYYKWLLISQKLSNKQISKNVNTIDKFLGDCVKSPINTVNLLHYEIKERGVLQETQTHIFCLWLKERKCAHVY